MAIADKTPINDDFEPDFEVTQVPIDELGELGIDRAEKIAESTSDNYIKLIEKREGARSIFAIILLVGFLLMLLIAMILGFLTEGDNVANIKDLILTISGVLSAPMGFVVGYYFKKSEEDK